MSPWLEIRHAFTEFALSSIAATKNLQQDGASILLLRFMTSIEVEFLLYGHILSYNHIPAGLLLCWQRRGSCSPCIYCKAVH